MRRFHTLLWVMQGFSGLVLLVVLALHLLANHTTSGLLTYDGAIARFKSPAILTLETIFLVLVIYHAFNGVRGVIADYVRSTRWNRVFSGVLTVVGAAAAAYGVWLGFALSAR
jgi:succinate dehydrogenase / fumarate reductase cytochrome b subunit